MLAIWMLLSSKHFRMSEYKASGGLPVLFSISSARQSQLRWIDVHQQPRRFAVWPIPPNPLICELPRPLTPTTATRSLSPEFWRPRFFVGSGKSCVSRRDSTRRLRTSIFRGTRGVKNVSWMLSSPGCANTAGINGVFRRFGITIVYSVAMNRGSQQDQDWKTPIFECVNFRQFGRSRKLRANLSVEYSICAADARLDSFIRTAGRHRAVDAVATRIRQFEKARRDRFKGCEEGNASPHENLSAVALIWLSILPSSPWIDSPPAQTNAIADDDPTQPVIRSV